MDYESVITIATQILIVAGILALLVSMIMEFLVKQLFSLSTKVLNFIIFGLSEVFTIIAALVYIQVRAISTVWYIWVGVVFLGFLVAIISMNGYDKIFSYVYDWLRGIYKKGE